MFSDKSATLLLACSTLLLAACDLPFLGDQEAKIEAKRQAEGMAVGSGCRYSGRPLEECYGMNPKMSKAAIFAGWREMDGYMRENNIQVVSPEAPEAPENKNNAATVKPKAAEASSVEEKSKAAETLPAPEKPKAAEAPAEAPAKLDGGTPKQPKRVA